MEFKNKVILTADVVNLNGHLYPLAELERIVENTKGKTIYGMIEMPELSRISNSRAIETDKLFINDLERQAFASEIVGIVDNQLLVNVKVLDTPQGLLFKEMVKDTAPEDIHFRTAGLCNYRLGHESKYVYDYELCSINYVNKPA